MTVYCIYGYDPIHDNLISSFAIPDDLTARCLDIVGPQYDLVAEYHLTKLTLDSLRHSLAKYGFIIDPELDYQIGPVT